MPLSCSTSPTRLPAAGVPVLIAAVLLMGVPSVQAMSLNGSAAMTTDYVWRGTTQTQGDPAVQAGVKIGGKNGLYGAVWGSSVAFSPELKASSELDITLGWTGDIAPDWALDVNLTHYAYPATTADINWSEALGTLTWRERYWGQVGYSPDALATGQTGIHAQLGAKFPLEHNLRLEAAVGHYWLEQAYQASYAHAQLGVVWAFKAPFELRVTSHAADSRARALFPGLAGNRMEAALQASF